MKKKVLAVLLAGVMAAGSLAGCGGSGGTATTAAPAESQTGETEKTRGRKAGRKQAGAGSCAFRG